MYPEWPKNRIICDGEDLTMKFRVALLDGYELNPPEPKTYTVDVPGGNGVIDLTTALTGDVVYNNRTQTFQFAVIDTTNNDFETVKTEFSNYIHGKAFDYQITMDPGYTYHGRFKVTGYEHQAFVSGILGTINVEVDAEPYKLKDHMVYKLNATGGKMFRLESGRMPVHPVIECEEPCLVTWNGNVTAVPAGTYRLNHVLFQDGWNEIYINSRSFWNITWQDVGQEGDSARTWQQLIDASARWDDIQRLEGNVQDARIDWSDVALRRWDEVSSETWQDFGTTNVDIPDVYVYLSYDWKDL